MLSKSNISLFPFISWIIIFIILIIFPIKGIKIYYIIGFPFYIIFLNLTNKFTTYTLTEQQFIQKKVFENVILNYENIRNVGLIKNSKFKRFFLGAANYSILLNYNKFDTLEVFNDQIELFKEKGVLLKEHQS
ncbi:MAG: hypothetical protein Q8S44_04740 [Flavobacteriaceae bacterium]|nr:hypothetical protein [Flavobacteriaceae bacterium]